METTLEQFFLIPLQRSVTTISVNFSAQFEVNDLETVLLLLLEVRMYCCMVCCMFVLFTRVASFGRCVIRDGVRYSIAVVAGHIGALGSTIQTSLTAPVYTGRTSSTCSAGSALSGSSFHLL